MDKAGRQIVIKGITREGRPFRPADWAQRLTTAVASLGPDRRIVFHPAVRMATRQGVACVVVDGALYGDDPLLFEFLLGFARNNDLQVEEIVMLADAEA
ncbi:MAG: DUF3579 domain-containing protein [Thiohalomonadaceae bacterium]